MAPLLLWLALLLVLSPGYCQLVIQPSDFTHETEEAGINGGQGGVGAIFETSTGYASSILCNGVYGSNRPLEDVWATEGCVSSCLLHTIFARDNPLTAGNIDVSNNTAIAQVKLWLTPENILSARIASYNLTYSYTGDVFGCVLHMGPKETVNVRYEDDGQKGSTHEWPYAAARTKETLAGVDYDKLQAAVEDWIRKDPEHVNPRAVLVVHQGRIIAEEYAESRNITAETRLFSFSVAKSVSNALLGMRIKDGALSLRDIIDLPAWKEGEARERNITVEDVERMRSGIDLPENYNVGMPTAVMVYNTYDVIDYIAGFPQGWPAGHHFTYRSSDTNLVMYAIRKSFQGNDVAYWSYPKNRLFNKIGARSMLLETDPGGNLLGSSNVMATARDYARLGLLYLQDGVWEGERLLPEGWVKYSTTVTEQDPGQAYAAGWWRHPFPGVLPEDAFYAYGLGGQWILVIPSKELVVVLLGLLEPFDTYLRKGSPLFAAIVDSIP